MASFDDEREYSTRDQGFAAYLMTKFMFLEAVDTGQPHGKSGQYTTKEFMFLVPVEEDMDRHLYDYKQGTDASVLPAKVMFEKMRLVRQACRQPEAKGAQSASTSKVR